MSDFGGSQSSLAGSVSFQQVQAVLQMGDSSMTPEIIRLLGDSPRRRAFMTGSSGNGTGSNGIFSKPSMLEANPRSTSQEADNGPLKQAKKQDANEGAPPVSSGSAPPAKVDVCEFRRIEDRLQFREMYQKDKDRDSFSQSSQGDLGNDWQSCADFEAPQGSLSMMSMQSSIGLLPMSSPSYAQMQAFLAQGEGALDAWLNKKKKTTRR
eukprot:TRINITY_DN117936_c0_g1_i1.p1 TRINITY_DN117936_c0_g1~~TRINITY_DN117936_c0_g1_i1.p1  ORF type:complete len:217 (-),score=39.99 TRINITY_DN117936_c0_g1_i1:9-635(-)